MHNVARSVYRWVIGLFIVGRVQTVSVGGETIRFVPARLDHFRLFHQHVDTERGAIEDAMATVTQEDVFWDVGAHHGYYTCSVGKKVPDGKVVAFEPMRRDFDQLQANVESNDLGCEPDLNQFAIADFSGEADVDIRGSGGWRFTEPTTESAASATITYRHGSEILEEHASPDVLKVSVAGAEYDVLRGLAEALPDVRVLYCDYYREIDPTTIHEELTNLTEDAFRSFLDDAGFEVVDTWDTDSRVNIKAINREA